MARSGILPVFAFGIGSVLRGLVVLAVLRALAAAGNGRHAPTPEQLRAALGAEQSTAVLAAGTEASGKWGELPACLSRQIRKLEAYATVRNHLPLA